MLFYNVSLYVKQSIPIRKEETEQAQRLLLKDCSEGPLTKRNSHVSYWSTFTAYYFMPPFGTVLRWKLCHACLFKTSGTAVDVLPFLARLTVHPEVAFQEWQECGLTEMNGIQVNFQIKPILEVDYFLLLTSLAKQKQKISAYLLNGSVCCQAEHT